MSLYIIFYIICTPFVHHLYIIDKYEYTVNVEIFALYIFSCSLHISKSANYVQRQNNNVEGII